MNSLRSRALAAGAAIVTGWLLIQSPALAAPRLPSPRGTLSINMQAQQKTNWCWAASATTIATYLGESINQTRMCQLAHNESGSTCANNQGNLGEVRAAFGKLDFYAPGSYLSRTVPYSVVQSEVDNDAPIETRILWTAGGGHMHVVHGYLTDSNGRQWVDWADPWGSNTRYNRSTDAAYRSNATFRWTHTLAGIRR